MLILAGVSINAIVGDNGVLTKTTYASFLSEMSAVEEAVQLWKAGEIIEAQGDEVKAIPANGLCNANDLKSAERLVGEVGYYRVWSLTSTMPTTDILSSANDFNSKFESELVFYPAGVQDLYYLNNDALEIKGNKTYLIDATTGMIYSMTGISLKGVRCYSLNMAKAVMNGTIEQPLFAEAEVSGAESGETLAGNVSTEYVDVNGNPVYKRADGKFVDAYGNIVDESLVKENETYNPNGFQILADSTNKNVYKLYNNGDLYGKGLKGVLLNSTEEEINKIDSSIWLSTKVPNEIPGASTNEVKVEIGVGTIFVIDKNSELWAWGNNDYNKMGLSNEEKIEFSNLSVRKINLNNKYVKKVIPMNFATYVITTDNELYVSGCNYYGELGLGSLTERHTEGFRKVDFPEDVNNIKQIGYEHCDRSSGDGFTFISTTTGNLYFAGRYSDILKGRVPLIDSNVVNGCIVTYTKVDTTIFCPKLDYTKLSFTGNTGTSWYGTWYFTDGNYIYSQSSNGTRTELDFGNNVSDIDIIASRGGGVIFRYKQNGTVKYKVICTDDSSFLGIGTINTITDYNEYFNDPIFEGKQIQDIWYTKGITVVKLEDGKIFVAGAANMLGIGVKSATLTTWTRAIGLEEKIAGRNYSFPGSKENFIVVTDDNEMIATNCVNLMCREDILQKTWKIVASNVKKFNPQTNGSTLAYIDSENQLFIKGSNSSFLGLNRVGEEIKDFVKITGEGATQEVKDAINSGIKKYGMNEDSFYVLTNSGMLLCSNQDTRNGGWGAFQSGLGEDDHPMLCKLLENVDDFYCTSVHRMAKVGNKVYAWGEQSNIGTRYDTPTELTNFPNDAGEWKSVICTYASTWILCDKGLLTIGQSRDSISNGTNTTRYTWEYLNTEESLKSLAYSGSFLALSNLGNIYGAGASNNLGDGLGASGNVNLVYRLCKKDLNLIGITGGSGWAIGWTEDGRVFGTGSNLYGILGRWKGADRKSPNSRYRTSYEWVECPELEI